MEIIAPRFAFDAESAGVIGSAFQAALHFFAHPDVFKLHLVGNGDAVRDCSCFASSPWTFAK